jgi:hypothetical protein
MFEAYPGISDYGSRRPIPMGDGGGRVFGGDRDKVLSSRRILVNLYRGDPAHQVVHAFNETTPVSSIGVHAYKDFLWRDADAETGDLGAFKLSHFSPGPGYVYARSSWEDDAVYFYFKCGDRFTAHQHLDVGHFLIYKNAELAGDGGHYDSFGSLHDVNYHMRSIAHNTVLVHDPAEQWLGSTSYEAGIRGGNVTGNDGGQTHSWPNHNGAVSDAEDWLANRDIYDIADITAFEDKGTFLYVAGDCSNAYSQDKLEYFTRQIVYIRPETFIVFDRVRSTDAGFKKTWLLHAMAVPEGSPPRLTITNGTGRLFVQTLLPQAPQVTLAQGNTLYQYDGQSFPPDRDTGPAPQCRIEVSPGTPAQTDYFLHVLTATDAATASAPEASVEQTDTTITVSLPDASLSFMTGQMGGSITLGANSSTFPNGITTETDPRIPEQARANLPLLSTRTKNGSIIIEVNQTLPGHLRLRIADPAGKTSRTLIEGFSPAGQRTILLNRTELPGGIHILHLETGKTSHARVLFAGRAI